MKPRIARKSRGNANKTKRFVKKNIQDNWVQCDICKKWRMLLHGQNGKDLPDKWDCSMNISDPVNNNCDVKQKTKKWYWEHFDVRDDEFVCVLAEASNNTSNAAKIHDDVIVRYRTYNEPTNKWTKWQILLTRQDSTKCFEYKFGSNARHGTLSVFPSLLKQEELRCVTSEILKPSTNHLYQKYKVQGVDEPRIHLLFHDDVTDDFQE